MSKKTQREIELETLVMQRDAELNEYKNRLTEAARAIADYKNREASIVGALTEAHAASKRMMDDARTERERILQEAQQSTQSLNLQAQAELEKAKQNANEILNEAKVNADSIIENANAEASSIIAKAQAEYDLCKSKVTLMNERITATAEDAARKIEEFRSTFSFDALELETVELSDFKAAAPAWEAPVFEEPMVATPSYEVPVFEESSVATPVYEVPIFEEPVATASAYETPFFEEPVVAPAYEAPVVDSFAEPQTIPFFHDEQTTPAYTPEVPVTEPAQDAFFASAPSPFAEPMPEPVPIRKAEEKEYYATHTNSFFKNDAVEEEAKVWTVDEAVSFAEQNLPKEELTDKSAFDSEFDAELDAFINDVLNS